MSKLYRAVVAAFAAALITSAAQADGSNTSARGLLSAWKGEDPNMRMVAEVIPSAFASGLSWRGTLAGKDVYCAPQGLKGGQVMAALDQFLLSNPDMAEKGLVTRTLARIRLSGKMAHDDLVCPAISSRLRSSGTPFGCICVSRSAIATSKIC
jgi:hypothetical protein